MTKLLFLGASGKVGETALKYLKDHLTDIEITLVTRKTEIDVKSLGDLKGVRILIVHTDVTCKGVLENLLQDKDLVISCLGPAYKIGNHIIDACVKAGVALLDVSGYDPALRYLDELNAQNAFKVPVVVNAGLLPGLSGSYPQYIIHKYKKIAPVSKVEVFYAGRDKWTLSSAIDIVSSLGGFGDNKGFCEIQNGLVKKLSFFKAMVKVAFPEPIKTLSGLSMYSEEMARLILAEQIPDARVSGANIGKRAGLSLMVSMLLKRYNSGEEILKGAQALVKAATLDAKKSTPFYGIHTRLHLKNGQKVTGILTANDTYVPTGIMVGLSAVYLLSHEVTPKGYSLHECVPSEYIIPALTGSSVLSHISDSLTS